MADRPTIDPQTRSRLAEDVARRGVQPVARELGVPRCTLTAVLAGTASPGTVARLVLAVERRQGATR